MMTMLLILFGLVGVSWIAAAKAPLGYQDERGFHFGRGPAKGLDEARCSIVS